jgi:spore germination cell wall hydrolase CwlJ-like protein
VKFSPALRGLAAAFSMLVAFVGGSEAAGQTLPVVAPLKAVLATAPAQPLASPAAAQRATLDQLVVQHEAGAQLDEEQHCLATAVYFEARGESLEGQLAVARVVINRAASGKYPASWCAVVKQPWQFSFVRAGQFPRIDSASDSWRKAQAIARIAVKNAAEVLPTDVLWYHADYVAPSWGRRLTRVNKIGAHIFYRS